MTNDNIKELFENLSIWRTGEQRAPHKPLLLLYALGKINNQKNRMISYQQVMIDLKTLLTEFGPTRTTYHTNYPFIRLVNDGVWELESKQLLDTTRDYSNRQLIELDAYGGFNQEIYSILLKDRRLISELAELLIENHFPSSLHDEILNAVGLSIENFSRKRRDPGFREKVLLAYEYKCAVCGFSVRLGNALIGLEAAHIMWHQAGGPDVEQNGIALCSMHHKLFDRGAFTINESSKIEVSEMAHGSSGFKEWLLDYNNKEINESIRSEYQPNAKYLSWHKKEVFKGIARKIR